MNGCTTQQQSEDDPTSIAASSRDYVTLADVDRKYRQIGCIGKGGFGSVFLAEKRSSGRRVAVKVSLLNGNNKHSLRSVCSEEEDDYYRHDAFLRELDAVVRLNTTNEELDEQQQQKENRDLSIILFHEWFIVSPGLACVIVMNFVDGGTLLNDISSRCGNPYSERRIAWYVLQLATALAYAHERNVAHHDIKSANVLIDWSAGGKLVLTDFGTSVAPGEDVVAFTPLYAAPELLAATYAHAPRHDKTDAFGLGCILFELVSCKLMKDLADADSSIGKLLAAGHAVDNFLSSPCIRLPWLGKEQSTSAAIPPVTPVLVGYSYSLKRILKALLEPNPDARPTPADLVQPLQEDNQSPLLRDFLPASEHLVPGVPVTIDNVRLGMFVQPGQDWDYQNNEDVGGEGSVGVVVALDPDGLYAEAAWSLRKNHTANNCYAGPTTITPVICDSYRIGAQRKFELKVGPTPLPDFYSANMHIPRDCGLLRSRDASRYTVGQIINSNCAVVHVKPSTNNVFVAPLEKVHLGQLSSPGATTSPPEIVFCPLRDPEPFPSEWRPEQGTIVEVSGPIEKDAVLELFHDPTGGGMDANSWEVTSIKKIQAKSLWEQYAYTKGLIASENWDIVNETRLFHGTRTTRPDTILFESSFNRSRSDGRWGRGIYFSQTAAYSHNYSYVVEMADVAAHGGRNGSNSVVGCLRQMFLARVAVGRVYESPPDPSIQRPPKGYHSVKGEDYLLAANDTVKSPIHVLYGRTVAQAYPEYLITYKRAESNHRPVKRYGLKKNRR